MKKSKGAKPKQVEPIVDKDLSGKQLDKWIEKVQEEIAINLVPLGKKEEELKQYKIEYLKLQSEYDEMLRDVTEDKLYLESLVRKRNGYKSTKQIKTMVVNSYTDKKPKGKKKAREPIPWSDYAVEVLKESGRFMKVTDIYTTIIHKKFSHLNMKDPKVLRIINRDKWSFINTIVKIGAQTSVKFKKIRGQFAYYGDPLIGKQKLGLNEWFDDNFIPLAKYMRDFMMDDGNKENGITFLEASDNRIKVKQFN